MNYKLGFGFILAVGILVGAIAFQLSAQPTTEDTPTVETTEYIYQGPMPEGATPEDIEYFRQTGITRVTTIGDNIGG